MITFGRLLRQGSVCSRLSGCWTKLFCTEESIIHFSVQLETTQSVQGKHSAFGDDSIDTEVDILTVGELIGWIKLLALSIKDGTTQSVIITLVEIEAS